MAGGSTVYRTPLGQRLGGAAALVFLAPVAAGMTVVTALVARQPSAWVLVILACAVLMWVLVAYLAHDVSGKWGLRAELTDTSVHLTLPRFRSLIHRPPPFRGIIGYADIAAIETRLEAYRSFGFAAMQRAYAIRRRSGEVVLLGEDRALGTDVAQVSVGGLAEALAARSGAPVIDKGMVEGRGGLLLVVGAAPDSWQAPSLQAARQAELWRRAALTGTIPFTMMMLGWILSELLRR